MPADTKDALAEILDVIDEWRSGNSKRDFTPILKKLNNSQLREVAGTLGLTPPKRAVKSRLMHDVVGRINGLAVGEEEYASTTALRNATDRRPKALPPGRGPRDLARIEDRILARRGEYGLTKYVENEADDIVKMTGPGVRVGSSPAVSAGRPARAIKDLVRVGGGAAEEVAAGGAAAAAGAGRGVGWLSKVLGKIPGPVKNAAGPVAIGLMVADLLSRGEDATFGREKRNRQATTMDVLDMVGGMDLGREEILTDLEGLGLARQEAITRELGATQLMDAPSRARTDMQSILIRNRAQLREAAAVSEPSEEEFMLALRAMGGA